MSGCGPSTVTAGVSILLCKRLGFCFWNGLQGKVPLPLPIRVEARRRHDAALSKSGIRSGQRMLKWLSASRQLRIGIVHFLAA